MSEAINIKVTTLNGFQNSFDQYIEWCDSQSEAGLPTCNWGTWWDRQKELISEEIK